MKLMYIVVACTACVFLIGALLWPYIKFTSKPKGKRRHPSNKRRKQNELPYHNDTLAFLRTDSGDFKILERQ